MDRPDPDTLSIISHAHSPSLSHRISSNFAIHASYFRTTLHPVKRWPVILTGVIDNLHNAVSTLYGPPPTPPSAPPATPSSPSSREDAKILEGKALISQLSQLKYEMARDRLLPLIPDDGGIDIPGYNTTLEGLRTKLMGTWFTAPWLFAEYIFLCCVITSNNDYFRTLICHRCFL